MDLFDFNMTNSHLPLADKMRPRNLDEFFGQSHLLAKGKILRQIIEHDKVTSMILQGPPSTGKTSLVAILSEMTKCVVIKLNAVSLGISEVRATIEGARENLRLYGKKTIVFIDEIHAMKSNVQMSLLPVVENGTIILIGATTESVMHDIIPPLVSRCRVYTFKPLSNAEIRGIIQIALTNEERGIGYLHLTIDADALDYLVDVCNGDVRNALSAIESIASSLEGSTAITLAVVKETYELRLNNTSTSDFYNLVSAFIKSMRASHTDAALYWLARLLYSGVDPLYIARRVVVHAAEDVGMANPQALQMAIAAKHAVEFVGMPEARIPLAEAVIFIAESPKSNAVYSAIGRALSLVEKTPSYEVPVDIQQGSRTYVSPLENPKSRHEYLPPQLRDRVFFEPTNSGIEARLLNKRNGSSAPRDSDG